MFSEALSTHVEKNSKHFRCFILPCHYSKNEEQAIMNEVQTFYTTVLLTKNEKRLFFNQSRE